MKAARIGDISSVINHIMETCRGGKRDINEKIMGGGRFCSASKI
jgi:hypothetical protein